MNPTKWLIGILGCTGILVIIFFFFANLPEPETKTDEEMALPAILTQPPITFLDPVMGESDASYTLVEYGDYTCALCQQSAYAIESWVKQDPSNRRFIWKDAPNGATHASALTAAYAGRCAQNQGLFWPMHKALMDARGLLNASAIRTIAKENGLQQEAFDTCMAGENAKALVERTLEEAEALSITGTPTLYLNGTLYTGSLTLDGLNAVSSD